MPTCKIMMLGDMGVGKTSIAKQLVFGTFEGDYGSTIGVDIYTYAVEPSPSADDPFTFLVWDTDGSFGESFVNLVYLRQAQAALVVADITRPATLESAARLAVTFMDSKPGRYLAVILNKTDLLDGDASPALPSGLRDIGMPIVQTSAKTGDGVKTAFHDAAATIVRRRLV